MNWHDLFTYDQGDLYWKAGQNNNVVAGAKAGTLRGGYVLVMVNNKNRNAHHIVWEMHNGPVPAGMFVDHEDRNRSNNRIGNLRLVTRAVNNRNKGKHRNNTSGTTGVRWNKKDKRWVAVISVDGQSKYLGGFKEETDAIAARKAAEKLYGFHPTHGT